jgi:hypothetical protein
LRRGVDKAEMWGVEFEDGVLGGEEVQVHKAKTTAGEVVGPTQLSSTRTDDETRREEARRKGGRVVGWSDKGTIHVWESDDAVEAKRT